MQNITNYTKANTGMYDTENHSTSLHQLTLPVPSVVQPRLKAALCSPLHMVVLIVWLGWVLPICKTGCLPPEINITHMYRLMMSNGCSLILIADIHYFLHN